MKAILNGPEGKKKESYVSDPAPITLQKNRDFWILGEYDLYGLPEDRLYFALDRVDRKELPRTTWAPAPLQYEETAIYTQVSKETAGALREADEQKRCQIAAEKSGAENEAYQIALAQSQKEAWNNSQKIRQQQELSARWNPQGTPLKAPPIVGYIDSLLQQAHQGSRLQQAHQGSKPAPKSEPKVEPPKSEIPEPIPFKRRMMKGSLP